MIALALPADFNVILKKFYMQEEKSTYVIGVMSGTSLDGVDLCYARFSKDKAGRWKYRILATECYGYEAQWRSKLAKAHLYDDHQLKELDRNYTKLLGHQYINRFIDEFSLKNIDLIVSHGHTIFHQPERKYTLQIGNRPLLADIIGYPLVCDLRVEDVAKGGQGAPLVPIGDKLLFPEFDTCVNIGGFVNISIERGNSFLAYDICPANKVLNHLSDQLGYPFDKNGDMAASGTIDRDCLSRLNDLDFYRQAPPRSLGVEWVEAHIFPVLEKSGLSIKDQLATFSQHIADQLAEHLQEANKILISGGGVYNQHLIHLIEDKLGRKVHLPDADIIEYKEALIFAFLGLLRYRGENNILASVTGAPEDHSAGHIFFPENAKE